MNQPAEDVLSAAMAPVYEHLGAAVYCCQSFERSISYLIALAIEATEGDTIDRLNAANSALRIAESIANKYIDAFLKRYGLSTEALKEQADATFRLLNFESFDDLPPHLH